MPQNWCTNLKKKERLASCMCTGQVCTEHRHLHHSFVPAARAPVWASHQGFYGNEHLALAETRVLGYTSLSQGTWTCWSNREISFLFGSAVFFFCDSMWKSVLAVLFKIAFSFSSRRIRVRVLRAGRKISCCMQNDFTRFFEFSSVKETIRKFHSCRKLKKLILLLVRKPSKPKCKSITKFYINWNQWRLAWRAFFGLFSSKIA